MLIHFPELNALDFNSLIYYLIIMFLTDTIMNIFRAVLECSCTSSFLNLAQLPRNVIHIAKTIFSTATILAMAYN